MSRKIVSRTGFTAIELLVTLAVIGLLMALLMPAVQSARRRARRVICQNQLRQCGLALHMYHDVHVCFPPGSYVLGPSFTVQSGWGWGAMILASIEQEALYAQIDFGQATAVGGNLDLIAMPIPLWRCPSDVGLDRVRVVPIDDPPLELASGNYCGSEGILSAMSHVRIGDIVDGTSQTLMAGERLVQPGINGSLTYTSAWCGEVAFQNGYDSTSVPHLMPNHIHPINGSENDPGCFGSRHAGGSNFVLGDASGRFLNGSIDSRVYEALGTSRGREVISLP